jgi:glycogen phosphorylase
MATHPTAVPAAARRSLSGVEIRTGADPVSIERALLDNLRLMRARLPQHATPHDWYMALAYTVRDRVLDRTLSAIASLTESGAATRIVGYLSAEFLMGPHLGNNLINLGIWPETAEALSRVGQNLTTLIDEEEEPGLGNGGLGRLAACYMDSLSTLQVPAIGYGIRYEFGIFDQEIVDGWQVERTDKWLRYGNPWEILRPEISYDVSFGGHTERYHDEYGRERVRWQPAQGVKGVAYDTPVAGYRVPTANLLRLWKAEATESFDFDAFNSGDYYGAVDRKILSETISKVLYPNDEPEAGKRLRLAQQHFFVSCSLQDMLRLHLLRGKSIETFADFWAAQLNDTHPSIAVAELMRLLIDEHAMPWEQAWAITGRTCAYTNHTLLPEALEKWSLPLFASLLPRHLEIIYEINRRFLDGVRASGTADEGLIQRLSLIDERGQRAVRMAHLAAVGSHAINGVAALHSKLLTETVLADLHRVAPEKFLNVTNGVTPRRWMVLSNPGQAALISRHIGDSWIANLEGELQRLEPFAADAAFQQEWREVKDDNKRVLAALIQRRTGVVVDPRSMFDVQVKRLHEYKRQHLNVLYLVTLYNRLAQCGGAGAAPRTVIFGGKAAPGYRMAKLMIKLITGVAGVVNGDARIGNALKVVFLPDFNVTSGQRVYPAADLSEQISTAGKEASGTGNMKFAMNGAVTIGTLDGANVEIREAVGAENFFLFGLEADQVIARKAAGYEPRAIYEANGELRQTIDMIADGAFSNGDRGMFRPLVDALLQRDDYMLFADYQGYVDCQQQAAEAFADTSRWTRMSILNAARAGRFSSDRSIRDYCRDIWHVQPVRAGVK